MKITRNIFRLILRTKSKNPLFKVFSMKNGFPIIGFPPITIPLDDINIVKAKKAIIRATKFLMLKI